MARLAELEGVVIAVKRLRTGDVLIEGKAVLERKRVADFLESLFDGRLFAQAQRLAEAPLRAFLILEGPASEWTHRHIKRESIQGAMLTLSVVFGIPVLRSQDEEETARLIGYTARQLQALSTHAPNRPGWRPKGKRALQIRVLSSLPKVGTKRAQRLLEHFRTLEQVVAADQKELAAVPGIGKQTAQSIHWAVHEDCFSYHG
jgi:ERCC4-type nuclease